MLNSPKPPEEREQALAYIFEISSSLAAGGRSMADLRAKDPEASGGREGVPSAMDAIRHHLQTEDFDAAVKLIIEAATELRLLAAKHQLPFVVYLLEMIVMECTRKTRPQ